MMKSKFFLVENKQLFRWLQIFYFRKISMSLVNYLVFDEADRMVHLLDKPRSLICFSQLDMGFEPQIRQIVQE